MSGYKTDQRFLHHRGRDFHFVSYEGQLANPKRGQMATPASWFLMNGGKRWMVAPQVAGQEHTELDLLLVQWIDAHVFGKSGAPVGT